MLHSQPARRSYAEIRAAIAATCQRHGYGLLAIHDVGATLRTKGIAYPDECLVAEICQPDHAAGLLACSPELASALPCRIAVHGQPTGCSVSMVSPFALLQALSDEPTVHQLAQQVEEETLAILKELSS